MRESRVSSVKCERKSLSAILKLHSKTKLHHNLNADFARVLLCISSQGIFDTVAESDAPKIKFLKLRN